MRFNVYASFLLACSFGVVAPLVARRLRPMLGTWLLTVGAVVSSVCAFGAMILCAFTLLGQNGELAEQGHWSAHIFDHIDPVKRWVALAAGVAVVVALWRAGRVVTRRLSALHALRRALRAIPAGDDLTVVSGDRVEAYAVPGSPGRIVITRGMLAALTRDEMMAVIAHERSHLRHRHYHHRWVVAVAAAVHPMLIPIRSAQEWMTERWADEDAARRTTPGVVASALRRVSHTNQPGFVLLASGASVELRIAALSRPPARWHIGLLVVAIVVLLAAVLALIDAVSDAATLFHIASTVSPVPLHHGR